MQFNHKIALIKNSIHSFFHKSESKFWTISLLFFLIAHVLFKFVTLNTLEVQGDEAFSVFFAQKSVHDLLSILNQEANPPLYYLFLHFWIKLFGIGLFSVKSLNILFSIGTAFFLFITSKKVGNIWFTIFVSSCFLFSDLQFDFSHEIRAFELMLLLTIASYYFFISYIQSSKSIWLFGLILINAALPFTQYNSILVPFVQFICSFFYLKSNKKIVFNIWLSYIISAIIFLPQLFIFFNVVPSEDFWLGLTSWGHFIYTFQRVIGYDVLFLWILIPYFISILILPFGLKYNWFTNTFSWKIYMYFWLLFILPLLINFAIAQYIPSFQIRYVLFTSLGMYLGSGYLFFHLKNLAIPVTIYFISISVLFSINFLPVKRDGEAWKETAELVKNLKGKKDAVVISASYKTNDFLYYYDLKAFGDYKNNTSYLKKNSIFPIKSVDYIYHLGNIKRFNRVILILSHNQVEDPNGLVIKALDKKLHLCSEIGNPFGAGIRIYNVGKKPCISLKEISREKESSYFPWFWEKVNIIEQITSKKVIGFDLNLSKMNHHFILDNKIEFSPAKEDLVKNISFVDSEIEFKSKSIPSAVVVVSIEKDGISYKRNEYLLSDFYTKKKFSFSVRTNVYGSYPEGAKVKTYIWNHVGPPIEIKKMNVKFFYK
jgi:hypothetical protein